MLIRGGIVYAEDNDDTRALLSRLLQGEGYQILAAHSFERASESLAEERVDLVIVDLGSPDRTGLALMSEVRRMHPAKGIVLSGYDTAQDSFDAGYSADMLNPLIARRGVFISSQIYWPCVTPHTSRVAIA